MPSRSIRGRPAARRTVLGAALPCLAASWPGSAAAQSEAPFPSRAVSVLVGSAPGGTTVDEVVPGARPADGLANEGVTLRPGPPEHFAAEMRAAEEEVRTLLRRAGIRLQ